MVVLCEYRESFVARKLPGGAVSVKRRKRSKGSSAAEADEYLQVVCNFHDVAVLNASELARHERIEPMSIYG